KPKTGGPGGAPGGPAIYVPPSLREGPGGKRVEGYNARRNDDTTAIRISNLSVNTSENDLEDLVKQFGPTSKMYLSRDKTNGLCKGFAYIHFKNKADAAKAIQYLNGYGYDHLILSVDWSKSTNQ
ncbi:eukaryotic translation initiation factor 3 subunit G-like, partial [Diaphorina citri]|uniref:Eukaryotic translation initiation factor 3 subunit G-like n=1 Tax=Diaphorina citri TaxID=121845 RepID=A0A1S3DR60_DIACI